MSLSWPCYLKDCVSPKWKSEEHCAEFWNGTSKSYGFKFLTYGEFQKYSDELVEFFKRHLVFEPNENKTPVVAVVWAPHILTSVVIHGIVKSGFPFFPILHATASFDLVTLQNHIDVIVVLCNPSGITPVDGFLKYQSNATNTIDSLFSRDDWCLFLRTSLFCPQIDCFTSPITAPNSHLIYIISTSGSFSNERKLVCVADSCLTSNVIDLGTRFPGDENCNSEDSCVVLASPLTFDPSIVDIYFALLTHRNLVMCPSSILSHPKSLSVLCMNANVGWLQCTPSQLFGRNRRHLKRLLSQPNFILLLGGEPFPMSDLKSLRSYKAALYSIYGTTEVSSWALLFKISASNIDFANNDVHCECSPPLYGSSPLGFPMLGTTSSLIPSTIENVWELGLSREFGGFAVIRPKGSSVTIEELSNALSQLAVKNMWPTADLVQYGECGSCLWFLGRKDRVIKRFGYQICLERLEHAIKMCTLPGVEINNCRCQISERSASRNSIIAFIEVGIHSSKAPVRLSKSSTSNHWKSIKLHIIKKLKTIFLPNPQPWLPTHFVFSTRSLPISTHGKLVYKPYKFFKFATLAKSRIIAIWNESLGLNSMNISHRRMTFLEAGGSSLMALNLVETLIQEFPTLARRRDKLISLIFTHPFVCVCEFIFRSFSTSAKNKIHFSKFSSVKTLDQSKFQHKILKNIEYDNWDPFNVFTSGSLSKISNLGHRVSLKLRWQHDLLKCVDASPLIVSTSGSISNGFAFVGSHSGLFSALHVPDGHPVWLLPTVSLPGRIEASSAFAYVGGSTVLAVGTLSGNLCTVDFEHGTLLCSYDTGGAVKSPASYLRDYGFLVVGSHGKLVHALDLRSMKELKPVWTNRFDNSPIVSPISLSYTSQTSVPYLIIGSLGGSFGCLDPRNPTQLVWMQNAKAPIFNKLLSYVGFDNKVNVIVAAVSGKIQSWSVLDGNINWSYDCSEKLNGHAIFSDPVLDFQTNNVILSTNKGFLFALNVFSGKLVWMLDCRFASFPSNLCSLNTPSLLQIDAFPNVNNCLLVETRADGMLFACSLPPSNTSKLSVQLESPSILSTYRLPSQCFSSPVLYSHNSNDVFVVTGCRDNHVYGLSL